MNDYFSDMKIDRLIFGLWLPRYGAADIKNITNATRPDNGAL